MVLPADVVPKIMRVFDLVRQGRSPTAASRELYITWGTVRRYCDADPDLRSMMIEAVREGEDTLADILLDIDRDEHYGQSDSAMAKVVSDNIKWLLSRRRPNEYGDKSELTVNLRADAVILQALKDAKNRVIPQLELQAITIIDDDVRVEDLR